MVNAEMNKKSRKKHKMRIGKKRQLYQENKDSEREV